jgi:hypothetical protein
MWCFYFSRENVSEGQDLFSLVGANLVLDKKMAKIIKVKDQQVVAEFVVSSNP